MIKYKVVTVCIRTGAYGKYIDDEGLVKAFEEGWEYVECNQVGNFLQYILAQREILQ